MNIILKKVIENAEDGYADFSYKLIPTIERDSILGLRAPMARKIAKEYANTGDGEEFLSSLPHKYHDENMVHAFMLGYKKKDGLKRLVTFLDYVDNWAVCDSLASSVKSVFSDKEKMLPYISEWLGSGVTYKVRFGLVCLLNYYVTENYASLVLELAGRVRSEEYYVNMANAWLVSVCLAKEYEKSISIIENCRLDAWTHNKAIQKALESFRISKEKKDYLRSLKRK
ncbi:MAG: DNA alkylation repair protein [Clostridia bacterium]|nr:DNA alkylation repair protein [Clostridia bacterium]